MQKHYTYIYFLTLIIYNATHYVPCNNNLILIIRCTKYFAEPYGTWKNYYWSMGNRLIEHLSNLSQ